MTTSPTPLDSGATRRPLRISLVAGKHEGPLDGAWWPQSRDLQTEGADLVEHFPAESGRIARLLFSRPDWDAEEGARPLRHILTGAGRTKVGSFPEDDTHVMLATMGSRQVLRLLVVPSDTDATDAHRLMERATGSGNRHTASALLAE